MKITIALFFLLLTNGLFSQEKDSLSIVHPVPKRASIYSAILPGAGQVYNKKYWKVPIIYLGFGIAGYRLKVNLEELDFFKTELIYLTDSDSTTVPTTNLPIDVLNRQVNQFKNWRDWSYVALGIIYALNIIDANVDAHLAHFDVGEDLSLEVHPYLNLTAQRASGFSLILKL